jgi:hypothetical protein
VTCVPICVDTYVPFYFHAQKSFGSGCEVCTVWMMSAHSGGFLSTLPCACLCVCVCVCARARARVCVCVLYVFRISVLLFHYLSLTLWVYGHGTI